jgi:integrase
MLGLRRRDIDLGTGRVRVERQLTDARGLLTAGPLRTAASRRSVMMPAFLAGMMREQLAARGQPGGDGLVFVNTAGHSPHASSFTSQVWGRAKRESGLEGVRWHDLRHTAVALAIERGAHAKVIQERMGHSTVKVTLDRYGHVLPSIEDKIADGLDQAYHEALPATAGP